MSFFIVGIIFVAAIGFLGTFGRWFMDTLMTLRDREVGYVN